VDLHGTQVTDADLAVLKDLRELRTLDLRLTKIGDEGVGHLKNLTRLQNVSYAEALIIAFRHLPSVLCLTW
jgi:hypothetical protein